MEFHHHLTEYIRKQVLFWRSMNVYFLLNDSPPSVTVICTFPLCCFTAYDIRLRDNVERTISVTFSELQGPTVGNFHGWHPHCVSLTQISPPQEASGLTSWTTLTFQILRIHDLFSAPCFMAPFRPYYSCKRWGTILLLLLFIKWVCIEFRPLIPASPEHTVF